MTVGAELISRVSDRLSAKGIGGIAMDLFSILILIPISLLVWHFQRRINARCNDIDGYSNSEITPINIAICLTFSIIWMLFFWSALLN